MDWHIFCYNLYVYGIFAANFVYQKKGETMRRNGLFGLAIVALFLSAAIAQAEIVRSDANYLYPN